MTTKAAAQRLAPHDYPLTWQAICAAGLVLGAGVIHFIYAPIHLTEARGQGIFFLILGFLQLGWGALVLRNPSPRTYVVGMVFATVMPALLYAVTRYIAAPFGDEAEGWDIMGFAVFGSEAIAALLLAWHGARSHVQWRSPNINPVPLALLLILLGAVTAGAAFGAGLATEAAVPWFSEGEESEHGGGGEETGHSHVEAARSPIDVGIGHPRS